jgi:hypothetical protein
LVFALGALARRSESLGALALRVVRSISRAMHG